MIRVVGEYDILQDHPKKAEDFTIFVLGDGIGYVKLKQVNPRMCPIVFDEKTKKEVKLKGDFIIVEAARTSVGYGLKSIEEDQALEDYLMRNRHTSPFEQAELTFNMKMPLCIAVHFLRHRTAHVNQESLRYTNKSNSAQFYIPDHRRKSATNKQGSVVSKLETDVEKQSNDMFRAQVKQNSHRAFEQYCFLLESGTAEEVARFVLPQNIYTTIVFKIDLHNLFHLLSLRMDDHAQFETQQYAKAMYELVKPLFPRACENFENYTLNALTLSAKEVDLVRKSVYRVTAATFDLSMFKSKRERDSVLSRFQKLFRF